MKIIFIFHLSVDRQSTKAADVQVPGVVPLINHIELGLAVWYLGS